MQSQPTYVAGNHFQVAETLGCLCVGGCLGCWVGHYLGYPVHACCVGSILGGVLDCFRPKVPNPRNIAETEVYRLNIGYDLPRQPTSGTIRRQ